MATISSSQIVTTFNYVDGAMTVNKPDVYGQLVSTHPKELGSSLFMLFNSMAGGKFRKKLKLTHNPTFSWFEDRYRIEDMRVNANVGDPGAGNSITFTLHTDSHNNAGASSAPQAGDVIMFSNEVTALVLSTNKTVANAHTVTCVPQVAADNIGALTAGDRVVFISQQSDEGSGAPDGLTPLVDEVDNDIMTIRHSWEATGTALHVGTWADFGDGEIPGKPAGKYYTNYSSISAFWEFMKKIEFGMIWSKRSDNQANFNAGDNSLSTRGLIPGIREDGILRTWDPAGGINIAFWNAMQNVIDQQYGAEEYMWFLGLQLSQAMTDFAQTTFTNGALSYGSFRSEDETIRYGLTSFSKDGTTHHFKTYKPFNHPNFGASAGWNFTRMGFGIPLDEVAIRDFGGDSIDHVPGLCLRYLADERKFVQKTEGMWSEPNTNLVDNLKIGWLAEFGLMQPAANRYVLLEEE